MERWRVLSLSVAVVAMAAVTVTVPTAATTPWLHEPLSDNVDDPLVVGSSSHHCDWTRAMGPVCVYNTTTQVSLQRLREVKVDEQ